MSLRTSPATESFRVFISEPGEGAYGSCFIDKDPVKPDTWIKVPAKEAPLFIRDQAVARAGEYLAHITPIQDEGMRDKIYLAAQNGEIEPFTPVTVEV